MEEGALLSSVVGGECPEIGRHNGPHPVHPPHLELPSPGSSAPRCLAVAEKQRRAGGDEESEQVDLGHRVEGIVGSCVRGQPSCWASLKAAGRCPVMPVSRSCGCSKKAHSLEGLIQHTLSRGRTPTIRNRQAPSEGPRGAPSALPVPGPVAAGPQSLPQGPASLTPLPVRTVCGGTLDEGPPTPGWPHLNQSPLHDSVPK